MVKKFECKNCRKQFEADDLGSVVCPHCQSDNVEPTGHHIPTLVWKFIVSAIVVMLVCCIVFFVFPRCERTTDKNDEPNDSVDSLELLDPPTVFVGQPVFNDKGMYSVDVKGKNVPRGIEFYYVMLNHFDHKVLQKNKDGHFSNIPYCEEDSHSYDFAIMDSREDTLICIPVEQTGFVKQIIIDSDKKMTQEQLQKLIDTQDESLNGVGECDYLAPDYKLKCIGMPSDMKKPDSWAELFEMIEFGIIDRITISQLSYDEKNRINAIVLKVNMP